ncbi:FkbM family methyltransferase [Candidatus Dependentiae bacterium]|nr:FkbM family methyltransferase [Candidatus Dependentiae bacterium]MCC7415477.1 FkbM family methyltransferase [Campylobacterota bacterium]
MMQRITKKELLPLIKQYLPDDPIIVEAGCFDGGDTLQLSAFWPQATIHAFEPVPEIFSMLTHNTHHNPAIMRHNCALAAHTGTAQLHLSSRPTAPDEPFRAGSLLAPKERLTWSNVTYPKTITVDTITLDRWAEQQQLDHIDFLWLDVQGFALPILQAAPQILKTLRVLYVEVEFIEAYEGQHQYHAVRTWLESQGFTMIARDFDDTPHWFFGNAILVNNAFL